MSHIRTSTQPATALMSLLIVAMTFGTLAAQSRSTDQTYAEALSFAERGLYPAASQRMREVNLADQGNLDAWKMRIWLSLMTRDNRDVFSTIEWLGERLPNQSHSARRQRLGISTAYYFGQVLGYVSIAQDAAASPEVVLTTSQLHSRFTEAQAAAFDAGFGSVTSAHAELMDQLAALRSAAQSDERGHRENRMFQLQQERDATLAELEQIEILRAENRQRSSEERNVHAATRSQVRNSSINTYQDRGVNRRIVVGRRPGTSQPTALGVGQKRTVQRGAASSSFRRSTGLNDRHYADVNRREQEYERHLDRRQRELQRQLRRIDSADATMSRSPNVGSNAQTRAMTRRIKSLATFVSMPVEPQAEIARILGSGAGYQLASK